MDSPSALLRAHAPAAKFFSTVFTFHVRVHIVPALFNEVKLHMCRGVSLALPRLPQRNSPPDPQERDAVEQGGSLQRL